METSKKSIASNNFLQKISTNRVPLLSNGNNRDNYSIPFNQGYLIITTDTYLETIQPFIEWKRLLGNNVFVESKPQGQWTATQVKETVQDHWFNDSIQYLLIIGGKNDVPGTNFSFSFQGETLYATTDYYYGLPMDSLGIPRIFRGRIPVTNVRDAEIVLDKIIQYELNPVADESFYANGVNCAYFQDSDNNQHEDHAFTLTAENIRHHLTNNYGKLIHRLYSAKDSISPRYWAGFPYSDGIEIPQELQRNNYTWNASRDSIASYINQGSFYVLYSDHGDGGQWSYPKFDKNDINSLLRNGNKLPVVFSICCRTGDFDLDVACFAENFLKKENGGCVGIIASTEKVITGYMDAVTLGMFDAIWPGLQPHFTFTTFPGYSPNNPPTYELGKILDQGLIKMSETFGLNYNLYTATTWKLFHCFGDPSMRMLVNTPLEFEMPRIVNLGTRFFVISDDGDCKCTFYDKKTKRIKTAYGNWFTYDYSLDNIIVCLDRPGYKPLIIDLSNDINIQNERIHESIRTYSGDNIQIGRSVTFEKERGHVDIQNSSINISGKMLRIKDCTKIINSNFSFTNAQ